MVPERLVKNVDPVKHARAGIDTADGFTGTDLRFAHNKLSVFFPL